jgi:hypothetical protein
MDSQIEFNYNMEFQDVNEFDKFTEYPLNYFNNDNIMTVFQNIIDKNGQNADIQKNFIGTLL